MSRIHFDPFEEMFVPPIHDGTKSIIDLDFTSSQLIQRHEWVHGQIFTSLPDGQLLAALLYLDNVDLTPLGISRKRQGELKDALINASRRAHEAAATYLSIKMEVPEAQKDLITSLDLDYRKYYSIFADILDNKFGSSYRMVFSRLKIV